MEQESRRRKVSAAQQADARWKHTGRQMWEVGGARRYLDAREGGKVEVESLEANAEDGRDKTKI